MEKNLNNKDLELSMKKAGLLIIFLLALSFSVNAINPVLTSSWLGNQGNELQGYGFQYGVGTITANSPLIYKNNTNVGQDYQPLIADMDNDGNTDIIIFSGGKINILNSDLNVIKDLSLIGTPSLVSSPAISYYYGSNNSIPYVIAILTNSSNTKAYYEAFTYDGSNINIAQIVDISAYANGSSFSTSSSGTGGIRCSADQTSGSFFDANNDGKADCVFKTWNATFLAIDNSGFTLKRFARNDSVVSGGAVMEKISAPSIGDIDQDGDMDAVITRGREITIYDENGNRVAFFNTSATFGVTNIDTFAIIFQADQVDNNLEIITSWNAGGSTQGSSALELFSSNGVLRKNTICIALLNFGFTTHCLFSNPLVQDISNTGFNFITSGNRHDYWEVGQLTGINYNGFPLNAISGAGVVKFQNLNFGYSGGSSTPFVNADIDNSGHEKVIGSNVMIQPTGELLRTFPDTMVMTAIADINRDGSLDIIRTKNGIGTRIYYSNALVISNGTLLGLGCSNTSLSNPLIFCEPFSYSDSILNHCQPTTFNNYCWKGIAVSPNGFELPILGKSLNFNYHFIVDKDQTQIIESRTPILTYKFRLNKFSQKSQEDLIFTDNTAPVKHILDIAWRDGIIYQLNPSNNSFTKLTNYTNNTYYNYFITFYFANDTGKFTMKYLNGTTKFINNKLNFINSVNSFGFFIWQYDFLGTLSGTTIKLDEMFIYRGVNETFNIGVSALNPATNASCFTQGGINICNTNGIPPKPSSQSCKDFQDNQGGYVSKNFNWAVCDDHSFTFSDGTKTDISAVACDQFCPFKVYMKHTGATFVNYIFSGTNIIIFLGLVLIVFFITYFMFFTGAGKAIRGK